MRHNSALPTVTYPLTDDQQLSVLSRSILDTRNINYKDFFVERIRPLSETTLAEDATAAVDILQSASKVGVFSDYDCDGLLAAEASTQTFQKLQIPHEVYIPERTESYGLSVIGIDTLHKAGCDVLLTSDCGSSSIDEVQHAKNLGMKVIVTDHHLYSQRPPADAMLNPINTEYHALSGCAVVCLLMKELAPELHDELVPFAAVTAISDVIPIIEESRFYLRQFFSQPRFPGLLEAASLGTTRLTLGTIGFQIVPKLNAISRMGQIHKLPLYRSSPPAESSKFLTALNNERKQAQNAALDAANSVLDWRTEIIVVELPESTAVGLFGIVAGRISRMFRKPALVGSWNSKKMMFKGSGRAPDGYDLHKLLHAAGDAANGVFCHVGGHPAAVGFSTAMKSDDYRTLLNDTFRSRPDEFIFEVPAEFDLKISVTELGDFDFATSFLELFPFGPKFPAPTIRLYGASELKFRKPFPKCYFWGAVHGGAEFQISDDALFAIETCKDPYFDFVLADYERGNCIFASND